MAVISLCACGGSGGDSSTAPPNNQGVNTPPAADGISVTNDAFSPGTKTVAVGTAVRWSWNSCTGDAYNGQTCTAHSVISTTARDQRSRIRERSAKPSTHPAPTAITARCTVR
ncbi:MAG TPA: hypothetical protein VLJ83_01600 [Gemmatimonadaceae bacterium]|nr:hypothetical protein [Gemmatimonadaceae bacterium]